MKYLLLLSALLLCSCNPITERNVRFCNFVCSPHYGLEMIVPMAFFDSEAKCVCYNGVTIVPPAIFNENTLKFSTYVGSERFTEECLIETKKP